ncbi:hypothetical protein QSU92_14295 [Microbacterium sp. ET2]|uniref:hypothetical protein n=1 Tax=Microbacterium albipurpureum TaxID=3050384 RepID=UPI00259D1F56|nr:hypothetical protein [Microbacterium sp. ET2 (Ac-2212)]WJL95105.1 hypothetical protein QSU92_14295 [Microbacterium sp. ET2 (Ac-2212)]
MRPAVRARGTIIAAVFSVLAYSAIFLVPVLTSPPGPLRSMRTAFWHDQLGYLSIVANAAAGNYEVVEPMTLTGVNHYPRSYYVGVGAIAHLVGIEPVVAWNAVSIAMQLAAVAMLAVTMSILARRWWAGLFASAPFVVGTLSFVTGGGWRTPLDSHAVLWGPYGVMFSSNAETAGLSVIVVVLCSLALVWARPTSRPARITVSIGSAAALGALSGFQTYSFITGVYLVAAITAAVFLWRARWWWWVASGVAVLVVIVGGPLVADRAGQLPALVFGLLVAVPGILLGVAKSRGMLVLYGMILAAVAAPPILWTVSGILSGDPFLTYRVASNENLGVAHRETLIASLPVALPILVLLLIAITRRDRFATPVLSAAVLTAALLSLNDLWGANAEPYRFWIDMFFLTGVVGAIVACLMAGAPGALGSRRRVRPAVIAAAAVAAVVYALSLADAVAFVVDPEMSETWNPMSSREQAIASAARTAGAEEPGLIATDSCVDPRTTKITSQQTIAYYYLGMAWPAQVDAVGGLIEGRLEGTLDGTDIAASGTRWLLTDTSCAPVQLNGIDEIDAQRFPFEGGEIVLTRIDAR